MALGRSVPSAASPALALPGTFVFLGILAAAEEVGWMGYAFEPMQKKAGGLSASLRLGAIWALWHLPFFIFIEEDVISLMAMLLILTGTRVLIVWIYNNTNRSVFGAILVHAASNTTYVTLPDIRGVAPLGSIIICGLVLAAAWAVKARLNPSTLRRREMS